MALKSLTVTLETVTPLFLGGADPRGEPELRAPSFRGALRYWLRAALGGIYGDDATGLAAVKKAEAQVFGSTETKQGGASAVALQVRGDLRPVECQRGRSVRVQKHGKEIAQPSGRDYLYWSMSGFRGVPGRRYYPEGSRFSLKMFVRPGAPDGPLALQEAIAALWLLVHLGGVGARSRRTGGSLSVVEPTEVNGLSFVLRSADPRKIAQELEQGLNTVRRLFQQHLRVGEVKAPSVPSAFDVLHPGACKIWVLGIWPSADNAIEAIGAAMRDFRAYREPDHSEVAKWLGGESIETVERSVFGLPLPFRYSNAKLQGVVQGRTEPQEKAIDRRASPLWLKISKTAEGAYVGIATLFNSRFLPPGERLHERDGKGPAIDPPPDYGLIQKFIAEKFDALEVSFGTTQERTI